MKKQSKAIIGITAGVLLIAVVVIVAVLMISDSGNRNYQKHMDLAQQYMDKFQYEQAIVEYEAAIAIYPNNEEAYQALAELCVKVGNYESAVEILARGITQTESEEMAGRLEEVQSILEAGQEQNESQDGEARMTERGQLEDAQENTGESLAREEREDWGDGQYAIYEYDEKGDLVRCTAYYADWRGDLYCGISQYDENENCVNVTIYDGDNQVWGYCVSEYDTDENMVKTRAYYANGDLITEVLGYETDEVNEILIQALYLMMELSYMTA